MTEILLMASVVLLTLGAAFSLKDARIGFVASVISAVLAVTSLEPETYFFGALILVIGLLNIITLYLSDNQIKGIDYAIVAMLIFATVLVIQSTNLAVLIGTFVLVSVPTYVLVMLSENDVKLEVGIKYITFMVFATVIFIIGTFLLVYSHSNMNPTLYVIGYVLLILGLGLEVGIAPLHEWVPDVFSAADPIPVSIIASIAKFVPFIVAFKLIIATANPVTSSITMFVAFLAVLSMFAGNIGALTSRDPGRVLGYSTVANMGYALSAFVAVVNFDLIYLAIAGVLMQLFANSAGKIGFFTAIKDRGVGTPFTYTFALSFIGMPPLMGFWSKLFIVLALVYSGYMWLAVLLVINSAISVPYYIRLAKELGEGWGYGVVNLVALIAAIFILMTVYPPDWFLQSVKGIVGTFVVAGV
jgi:NADH-quinone oxidoreductase subunit N